MNYKELIEVLRTQEDRVVLQYIEDAATAIETLLAEREAMESDLLAFRTCSTCANSEGNRGSGGPCYVGDVCTGQYWQWRGPTPP